MLDMKYGIYILCHGKNISDCNRTFAHSKFNKKKLQVYHKSYFPYDEQNGAHSRERESNGMDQEFEYDFLTILQMFELCKKSDNFITT